MENMLEFYFNSLLTVPFTYRATMERYAIHSKSSFHIQQNEEYVHFDNGLWWTDRWLPGKMFEGQKHGSGRMQDRERQVETEHKVW